MRKHVRGGHLRSLTIVPCTLQEANAFVAGRHRHRGPVLGARFALGCADAEGLHGVAIVGRPIARGLDDGWTAEVTRVATDGARNACSMLYGAAWRAARAIGYRRGVTYTRASEPGTSLRAAGWKLVAHVPGRSWNCRSRPREDKNPIEAKCRWEITMVEFQSDIARTVVVSPPHSRVVETVTILSESAAKRLETAGSIPPAVRRERTEKASR